MGSTEAAGKTEEELRKEIDELLRQQRQVPKPLSLFFDYPFFFSFALNLFIDYVFSLFSL